MQKLAERPKAKRALLVTGVVLAVVGGMALAERTRRKSLTAKESHNTMPGPLPWGIVGFTDL